MTSLADTGLWIGGGQTEFELSIELAANVNRVTLYVAAPGGSILSVALHGLRQHGVSQMGCGCCKRGVTSVVDQMHWWLD